MKRFLSLLLAMLMLVVTLTGCSGGGAAPSQESTENNPGASAPTTLKIGLTWDMANELFASCLGIMEEYCAEKGYELVGVDSTDTTTRITAIENLVTSGCNVLIVHINDVEGLTPTLQNARDKGVKIFCYDMDIDTVSDAYYGCLNYDYGKTIALNACEWINETFDANEEVQVAILCKDTRDFLVERKQGILDTLAENCPNSSVVMECSPCTNTTEGVDAGENILMAYPDIDVVIGVNDGGALGVYEAFTAAGHIGDTVGIFAGDCTGGAVAAIAQGGIYRATVDTQMAGVVTDWIDICANLVTGVEMEQTKFYFPMLPVTLENLSAYTA